MWEENTLLQPHMFVSLFVFFFFQTDAFTGALTVITHGALTMSVRSFHQEGIKAQEQ